jgi:myo-inositol-1(or 4)-monophosphatase
MHPIVNIAVSAARQAGKVILRAQDRMDSLEIIEKGKNDFASQVDKAAEDIIIDTIKKAYPHHAILAEESGVMSGKDNDTTWIIDPLDGTTNFLHGFPHFCVSIAVTHLGKIQHGVIYDPIRDELYSASRGEGARMNGNRLRVSKADKLEKSLLGTGFPYTDFDNLDEYLKFLKVIIPSCAGIRRAGSAALDLAYVAAGRLDGFWEFGLKPWDIAAGALLVQEAGGYVSTMNGDLDVLSGNSILAGPPKIFQQMALQYKHIFSG